MSDDVEMVWFSSYRDCNCTFVGADLARVPVRCPHDNAAYDKPHWTANPLLVPHGLETREQTRARG